MLLTDAEAALADAGGTAAAFRTTSLDARQETGSMVMSTAVVSGAFPESTPDSSKKKSMDGSAAA